MRQSNHLQRVSAKSDVTLTARSLRQLRSFDRELDEFKDRLHEFPIEFPPSYPFEENVHRSQYLMKTRCPSWCDRIVMSKSALDVIHQVSPWVVVTRGV